MEGEGERKRRSRNKGVMKEDEKVLRGGGGEGGREGGKEEGEGERKRRKG